MNPAGSGPYSLTVGSLNNGTDYSFTVEVCNNTYCSTSDPSPSVHPFGAPIVPAPNMSNNGRSVTVSWGAVNWNGAGAGSAGLMINGEGSSCNSGDAGAGGSCTFIGASNITYQATFGATNDQGQSGQATSNSVTTPPPEINVSRGASAVGQPIDATHTCDDPSCAWIVVELVGFAPNTHYTVQLDSGMGGFGSDGSQGFDTDGAGNAQGQTTAFFGDPNSWVSATTGGVTGTRNPWAG